MRVYIYMEVLLCNCQKFKKLNMICFPCSPRCKSILRLLNYHVSLSKPASNGSGLYDSLLRVTDSGAWTVCSSCTHKLLAMVPLEFCSWLQL